MCIFGPYTEDDAKPYLDNGQWILRDNLCDFLEILPYKEDVQNLSCRVYSPVHDLYNGSTLLQCWQVLVTPMRPGGTQTLTLPFTFWEVLG